MTRDLQWQDKEIKFHSMDKAKTFKVLRAGMVEASGINKPEKRRSRLHTFRAGVPNH